MAFDLIRPTLSDPTDRPPPDRSMVHPPITIPMAAVLGMLSGVRARCPEPWTASLVGQAGFAPALLQEVHARVTGEQYVKLFCLLMDRLDDECLGLLPRPLRRGSFALVARSTLGVATVGQALRRMAQGFDLLLHDVRPCLVQEDGLTGLAWALRHPDGTPPPNFLYEMLMRVSWRLLAWLHGGKLLPARCDFCFARPDYADIYARIFPGPLRFDRPSSVVWFNVTALATPVHRDAAALERFLQGSPGNVVLPWLGERAASARVHALLRRTSPQWPDLAATAASLHMSVSTLQRHLAQEGTSFQALKDQLRRDLAIVRLSTGNPPLAVLAAELGFSDSAAFQRAFKTWTGSSPGSYKKGRQGSNASKKQQTIPYR